MSRTYADAIDRLNSLQSNAQVIDRIRASGGKDGSSELLQTAEFFARIGYSTDDLNKLNAIHITGTKGKGSTSAFVSSLLCSLLPAGGSGKVGLYTSPHMMAVRERIRINGAPIEEEMFARYFFELWDKLEATAEQRRITAARPAYFRYLTLLAFHVFLCERVDASIIEVGIGGTFDTTNVIPSPITTGVTALGIDHVAILGNTIEQIAHQKGGIYKPGVPALTVSQPDSPLSVLRSRATELGANSFTVVTPTTSPSLAHLKLGLPGAHQYSNASLAVALVRSFLWSDRVPEAFKPQSPPPPELDSRWAKALEDTRWPGRCQAVRRGKTGWWLDGAHTVESLKCCVEWWRDACLLPQKTTAGARKRALIFNCTSGRSAPELLAALSEVMTAASEQFDSVAFCTNTTYGDGRSAGDLTANFVDATAIANLTVQNELRAAWLALHPSFPAESVFVLPSIQDAVAAVTKDEATDVLVAGSLHLVGGLMQVVEIGLEEHWEAEAPEVLAE